MLKLNRKVEYALIALKHMHRKYPGELTTAKEICEQYDTPFDATSRVLQVMTHHGWIKSEQGVRGGYQIFKDLSRVSLLDLVETIEGSIYMVNCLDEDESHCDLTSTCNIISPIMWLNARFKSFLKNLSVHDLIEMPGSPGNSQDGYFEQFTV